MQIENSVTESAIATVGREESLDSVFSPGFGIWLPKSGYPTFVGSKSVTKPLDRSFGRFEIFFELDVERLVIQQIVLLEVFWRV